ncbi:hypothetical protein [Jiangella asiatica]|uniref:Uncharacterized protein n=1 Tax=Jiangella asiatica TaxID=2530372 RepID=A0A4R5DLN0_9ACTN|nr:hypothetical protein [Jiangella asiatica]TDE15009.1 hypothetical protein E1269_02570 [Jiangella asiatica]
MSTTPLASILAADEDVCVLRPARCTAPHQITEVATVDHRHFTIVRPKHVKSFTHAVGFGLGDAAAPPRFAGRALEETSDRARSDGGVRLLK